MRAYEYKVIPAPAKGVKAKGVKTPEERFSLALQELMNRMGAEGWEDQRAETLPSTERAGLTGTATHWRHVLIFRRAVAARAEGAAPDWPAPPTDFAPRPGEHKPGEHEPRQHEPGTREVRAPEVAATPRPEEDRPHRPTLVATRNDPADSGV